MLKEKHIKWLGTGASVAGSFLVAFGFFLTGYTLFLIGAFSWLIIALIQADSALFILNLFFMLANIIGFFHNV